MSASTTSTRSTSATSEALLPHSGHAAVAMAAARAGATSWRPSQAGSAGRLYGTARALLGGLGRRFQRPCARTCEALAM